jgi:hypothetical protein
MLRYVEHVRTLGRFSHAPVGDELATPLAQRRKSSAEWKSCTPSNGVARRDSGCRYFSIWDDQKAARRGMSTAVIIVATYGYCSCWIGEAIEPRRDSRRCE